MTEYENFQERTIAFNWMILVFFTTLAFVLFLFYLKRFYPEQDTNLNSAIAIVSMLGFLYCIYLYTYSLRDGQKLAKGVYKNSQGQLVNADGQFVNEQGHLVNAQGQLVNSEGQLVNEQGQMVNAQGQMVNAQGQLVNAQGQIINAQGQIVNAQGQMVNAQGQLVNAQGQLVNAQGQLVNEKGQTVNSKGELVNEKGELVNEKGQTVNSKGELVNEKGEVITNQYTTYSPTQMGGLTPTPYNGTSRPSQVNAWHYNEKNQLVNEKNQRINNQGTPINEQGQPINAQGRPINDRNQLINEKGEAINDKGQLINDKNQLINEKGEAINENGQRIDENGQVINQNWGDYSPAPSDSSSSLFLNNLMNAVGGNSNSNVSQTALGNVPKLVFGEIYLSDNQRNVIIVKGQYLFNFYLLHLSKDVFTSSDGINFTDTNNNAMKAIVINNGPPSYLGQNINGKGIQITVANADSTTSVYYFYSSEFAPALVQGDSFISTNSGQSTLYVNDTNAFNLLDKASNVLASYTSIDGIHFSISSSNNCSKDQSNQYAQYTQYNQAMVMVEQDSSTAISTNINTLGQCIRLTNTSNNTNIYYYWNYNKLVSNAQSNAQSSSSLGQNKSNTPYFSCTDPLSVVQYTVKNNQSPDIYTKLNTCSKQQMTDAYSLYKIMYPNVDTFSNRREGLETVQNANSDEINAGKVIVKAIADASSSSNSDTTPPAQNSGSSIFQPSNTDISTSPPIFGNTNNLAGSSYTPVSTASNYTNTYTPITDYVNTYTPTQSYTPTYTSEPTTTTLAPTTTTLAPTTTTLAPTTYTSAPTTTTLAPVIIQPQAISSGSGARVANSELVSSTTPAYTTTTLAPVIIQSQVNSAVVSSTTPAPTTTTLAPVIIQPQVNSAVASSTTYSPAPTTTTLAPVIIQPQVNSAGSGARVANSEVVSSTTPAPTTTTLATTTTTQPPKVPGLVWKSFNGPYPFDYSKSIPPHLFFNGDPNSTNNNTKYNTFQKDPFFTSANTKIATIGTTVRDIWYDNNIADGNNASFFGFTNNTRNKGGDNISLIFKGYFKPDTTGPWKFSLGNDTKHANDDICVFWIDDKNNANGTTSHWPPSDTNWNFKTVYNSANWIYETPSLTAGTYYPIQITWGQSYKSSYFKFCFLGPNGGPWKSNGDGYYFSYTNPDFTSTQSSSEPTTTTLAPPTSTTTAAPPTTLILYYPFNVDVKNYATGTGVDNGKISGFGTTLALDKTSYKTGSGSLKQSKAAVTNSYFTIPTIPANTKGYTFAFWLNFKSDYWSVNVFNFNGGKIKFQTYNGTIYLFFGPGSLGIGNNFKNADYMNKWNHFVWTIDKTGNTTLYLNGTPFFNAGGYTYFSEPMNSNFILGGDSSIEGNVDDFRYYDGIVTQNEVTAIYNMKN